MPKPANPEDILTAAELAELRGVHVRTIHRMVKRGQLTAYMKTPGLRGAYLFRRADVADVLNQEAA